MGITDDHYGAFMMQNESNASGVPAARVLVVSLQSSTDPFWGSTDRVARRGVFVRTTNLLPVDSSCLLKITREGHSGPLWAHATVVHHIPGVGFGCHFTQLTPEMRSRLDRWLEESAARPLPSPPHRKPRSTDQI